MIAQRRVGSGWRVYQKCGAGQGFGFSHFSQSLFPRRGSGTWPFDARNSRKRGSHCPKPLDERGRWSHFRARELPWRPWRRSLGRSRCWHRSMPTSWTSCSNGCRAGNSASAGLGCLWGLGSQALLRGDSDRIARGHEPPALLSSVETKLTPPPEDQPPKVAFPLNFELPGAIEEAG